MTRKSLGVALMAAMLLLTLSACQRKTDQGTPGSAEQGDTLTLWYEDGVSLLTLFTDSDTVAVHLLGEAARRGNAKARLALGVCYFTGRAVEKDYKQAAEYMADAANEGNRLCQMLVAICRGDGLGDGRDYAEVLEWLKTHEGSNPLCQYLLGLYYENCTSLDNRYREALRWYRKLAGTFQLSVCGKDYPADFRRGAENGEAKAQYCLGLSYEIGDGVGRDFEEAAKWYRKAAEQGLPDAQLQLGDCYFLGLGVRQNLKEAARWYGQVEGQSVTGDLVSLCQDSDIVESQFEYTMEHSRIERVRVDAMNDYPSAQYDLGYLAEYGYVDDDMARMYTEAAERGDAEARYKLGCLYRDGKGVKKDLRLASKWLRKAQEHGFNVKRMGLESCLAEGDSVPHDRAEAFRWYRKAAEQGNADAQFNLAYCYDNGYGAPKLPLAAAGWYRKAAEQGHPSAMCRLAGLLYGVNEEERVKWLRKAAELGNPEAQYWLGMSSLHGQNPKEAAGWILKAAEQGLADAQREMADRYENGDGVPQSQEESDKWFTQYAQRF
ncbi:MAG: sel1 repeat family protein [Prevotellaceae bacterium]|nr:sel1 repeat family protein [Prevotellaceae bacterium]